MKIVVLERNSVGLDVDMSCFQDFGEVTYYPNTLTTQQVEERAGMRTSSLQIRRPSMNFL